MWPVRATTWQTSLTRKYRRSFKLSCKTAKLSSCKLPIKFSQQTRRWFWMRCQLRRWRICSLFWYRSSRSITKESAWLAPSSKRWQSRETRLYSIREAALTAFETGLKVTQRLNVSSWLNWPKIRPVNRSSAIWSKEATHGCTAQTWTKSVRPLARTIWA